MRVNLMTIWSAIFVLLGVHSVWTRHLPWIIYPSPLWSCHNKSRSDPVQQSIWKCRLLQWGHFAQGGGGGGKRERETVANLSFIGSLAMLFSQFRVQCHQYHAFFEVHENKSDDLLVMHYQTRRINSKVIHLTICLKFRANHFRNIELIINHLFPNSWINTTLNCLWWIIPDLRLFIPRCDSGVWEIAFAALALPWRTCASLRPNHRSLDCLFKIIVWKHPNSHVWDFVICNKLFLILWQYPYQMVSMPFATRNHVSQHYHCSKTTLALYSWDVIILIHYFGCRGVNLPFGESCFAVSPL